jgi:hypothetical protein
MSVTIDGSGTITGISAGGLPDGVITNDDLAGSIADAKLSGTTCKAWVNFNGTGTVAIRASFNVSSITDNNTGDYTVNFTNAMTDANYCACVSGTAAGSAALNNVTNPRTYTSSSVSILSENSGGQDQDRAEINVAIFR